MEYLMRIVQWMATLAVLAGCDDTVFDTPSHGGSGSGSAGDDGGGGETGGGSGDSGASDAEGWCAVQATLRRECLACHSASSSMGELDLETDAHAALVGATSAAYGVVLVEAGDRSGSLLWRKLEGSQASGEGGVMPPSGAFDADVIEPIGVWIDAGASDQCDDPVDDTGQTGRFHPDGWAEASEHGHGAKHGELPCVECHGDDLDGGIVGVSCDTCHDAGWRTDCTFCHGGTDNSTGAPPRDIDGQSTTSSLSFQVHSAHVEGGSTHDGFDCVECHTKPDQVLSVGHVFVGDSTPGQAEVDFSAGLSSSASWSGTACSNLYCHGYNGRDNGSIQHTASAPSCSGCHPGQSSSDDAWEDRMSGEHEEHLDRGARCSDCHSLTVSSGGSISDPEQHVDGVATVSLEAGMSRSGTTCTGTCHIGDRTENHSSNPW